MLKYASLSASLPNPVNILSSSAPCAYSDDRAPADSQRWYVPLLPSSEVCRRAATRGVKSVLSIMAVDSRSKSSDGPWRWRAFSGESHVGCSWYSGRFCNSDSSFIPSVPIHPSWNVQRESKPFTVSCVKGKFIDRYMIASTSRIQQILRIQYPLKHVVEFECLPRGRWLNVDLLGLWRHSHLFPHREASGVAR